MSQRLNRYSRRLASCAAVAVLFCLVADGYAADRDKPSRQRKDFTGFYIGIGAANVSIGGDMDGSTFVSGGGSAEVLPDVDTATGEKLILGYQWDNAAIETNLVRSDHDGVWSGVPLPTRFSSLNFDGKYFFGDGIKPYVVLGLGFIDVEVENGSTDGFVVADATFEGLNGRIGGGAHFPIAGRFAIEAQALYRAGNFNHVNGIVSGPLDDDLDGNGLSFSVEAKISLRGRAKKNNRN